MSADRKPLQRTKRVPSWVWWFSSLGLGVAASWVFIGLDLGSREAGLMAGIFVLAAALWITEALPLFATSLLIIGLQALLLANPGNWKHLGFEAGNSPTYQEILSTAADPVLVLFFGGLVLARAAVKEGVDRTLSAFLLRPFGGSPRWVLLGVMLVTLSFGYWMSNTATAAMMLALITPMLAMLPPGEPFRKGLVLCVPLTANISGMGTPISSPPNAVAIGFLQQEGHEIAFLEWMLVAGPLVVSLTLLTWAVLWKSFKPASATIRLEIVSGRLAWQGWLVVGVFAATVLLWMTDRWHGLPAAVVALLPAVVLTTTRVFNRDDLSQIDWSILILIAGGISLGTGVQRTGLDAIVIRWLPGHGENGTELLVALVLLTVVIGTFMSNTAAANLFLPIGLSSATLALPQGGLHPIQIGMSIALAASMSMALPISTPPNAMAYGRGEFTTADLLKVTLIVTGTGVLAIIFGGGFVLRLWKMIP